MILKEDKGNISKTEISLNYLIDGRDSIVKPKNGYLFKSDLTVSGLGASNSFIKGQQEGRFIIHILMT